MNRTAAYGLGLLLACTPAFALTGHAESGASQDGATHNVSPELRSVIDDIRSVAERAPNAVHTDNPEFFNRLDSLLAEYSRPELDVVWEDTFSDGNYTYNPSWTVRSGTWTVEGARLTSNMVEDAQAAENRDRPSGAEVISGIVGAIGAATGTRIPGLTGGQDAAIAMKRNLSNAFAIHLGVADLGNAGTLEAGVYQDGENMPGYRLVYVSGPSPRLALVRASDRGTGNVARASQNVRLDTKPREIAWTRNASGEMQVRVDGTTVLEGQDKTFGDPWTGFVIINRGGHFTITSAQAKGVPQS